MSTRIGIMSLTGSVRMKKLHFALALGLSIAGNASAAAEGSEEVKFGCQLPAGWSELAEIDPRFIIFGELHGTNEAPEFVKSVACALARENHRVLVAFEQPTQDNEALQAAWESDDDFEERLATIGYSGRADGTASMAMFRTTTELHRLKRDGLPISVFVFNGFKDEQQYNRLAHLPFQGPSEAAKAENIREASTLEPYDYVLILVGNFHAIKTSFSRNGIEFDPMARLLSRYGETVSLNMRYADGTSWNCSLKPGVDRTAGGISTDDVVCGANPTKGEAMSRPAPAMALEQADDAGEALPYDGFFWVGSISASPPKSP